MYKKKVLHLWTPPEVIPETKGLTDSIIKFCNLDGESITKDVKVGINGASAYTEVKDNAIRVNAGSDYALINLKPLNKSAEIELKAETNNLKTIIKASLDNLREYDFISADAHTVNEQRALYDLGFKPVAYMPLFDVKDGKRVDAFTFVKLQGTYDWKAQKEKLLGSQRNYKMKRLADFVYGKD